MHIHEYQAKKILSQFGIKTPPGMVSCCEEETRKIISSMKIKEAVVKAQIHAGGRFKMRGIKVAKTPEEIVDFSNSMFGKRFINNQTGANGLVAHLVLIEPIVAIEKEFYLSIMIDRTKKEMVLIGAKEGGSDVELQKKQNPDSVIKIPLDINGNIKIFNLIKLLRFMSWTHSLKKEGVRLVKNLINAFISTDATLIEINPLILTKQNEFLALDAKVTIDDNALFRQKEIAEFYDPMQLTKLEVKARKFNLSYVPLKGNIGCLVNGAGLAMATTDILNYFGGEPANFLDLGGTADKKSITEGFKILLEDRRVDSILIHIFGGVMDCEIVADALLDVLKKPEYSKSKIPIVVRMEGYNRQNANYKLIESGYNIIVTDNLVGAIKQVIIKAGIL
jgi:succinyl-CoA synthetase beta subunit